MPRYVAFLRGVSPMNARMPELKRCFEKAGFTHVKTVLGSGNVVFDARAASGASLERRAEAVVSDTGLVFMSLIEKTFGSDVTTRTWDTVRKCASA